MTTDEPTRRTGAFDANKALGWWRGLQPDPETKRPGDRGALAALRRCRSATAVQFVPAFELLVRGLPEARLNDLAVVAAVLAHVREHEDRVPIAEALARVPTGGTLPPVTPPRFRRLLHVRGEDERFAAGVRLVRQLKGSLNVRDLAESLYWWDENDITQRRWARGYYSNLPADLLKH